VSDNCHSRFSNAGWQPQAMDIVCVLCYLYTNAATSLNGFAVRCPFLNCSNSAEICLFFTINLFRKLHTFFSFMNPIIFVPFLKHPPLCVSINSAMVAFNKLATQQDLHHLAGKDLLTKHIVTAIEICGMQLFIVQKRFNVIKTFLCLPHDSLVP